MKTKEEARANLEAAIGFIPDRYRAGVGRADWATPAGSDQAERNYADAVSKAVAQKRRQVAVKQISNSEWQSRAIEKGGAVIAERIRGAMDKWFGKWAPIYDRVVSDVARLPARGVDFRTNITNRVVGTVESWKRHSGKL
ncbi:MAG: hypothetical protein JRE40_14280 [Deltaproteobacteria bacterium]|nr:hypothetical protein [Deltaproteobacteria bacterium]